MVGAAKSPADGTSSSITTTATPISPSVITTVTTLNNTPPTLKERTEEVGQKAIKSTQTEASSCILTRAWICLRDGVVYLWNLFCCCRSGASVDDEEEKPQPKPQGPAPQAIPSSTGLSATTITASPATPPVPVKPTETVTVTVSTTTSSATVTATPSSSSSSAAPSSSATASTTGSSSTATASTSAGSSSSASTLGAPSTGAPPTAPSRKKSAPTLIPDKLDSKWGSVIGETSRLWAAAVELNPELTTKEQLQQLQQQLATLKNRLTQKSGLSSSSTNQNGPEWMEAAITEIQQIFEKLSKQPLKTQPRLNVSTEADFLYALAMLEGFATVSFKNSN